MQISSFSKKKIRYKNENIIDMNRMSRLANTEGLAVDLKEVEFLNGRSAENRFKMDK